MKMIRIYIAVAIVTAIFFAYITGVHVGGVRCVARMANANAEQMVVNTKIMDKANEVVLHTGVNDVRRILRQKYTIAE